MKKNTALTVQYLLFALLLPVALYIGYCTYFRSSVSLPEDRSRAFNSRNAAAHLTAMGSVAEESPEAQSGIYKYIRRDLLSRGLKITEFFTVVKGSAKEMKSLVGTVPGLKQDILIVSTHYDHHIEGGPASGYGAALALALELSRVFSVKSHQMTIWFMFLDGKSADGKEQSDAAEQIVQELQRSGELAKVKAFISLEIPSCSTVDLAHERHSSIELLNIFKDAVVKTKKDYLYNGRIVDSSGEMTAFQKKGVPSIELIGDAGENAPGSSRDFWALGNVMDRFISELDKSWHNRETN